VEHDFSGIESRYRNPGGDIDIGLRERNLIRSQMGILLDFQENPLTNTGIFD
jgi:hypothetical protein